MSQKRVLLLHEDRLLANLFREKIEQENLVVEIANDGAAGLNLARDWCADAVVLDPAAAGPQLPKLIHELRQLGGKQPLPVIVLPNIRPLYAEHAHEGGAVALARGVNPVADVLDALETALKLEPKSAAMKSKLFRAEDRWLIRSLASSAEVLTALRRTLHEISRDGRPAEATSDFYHRIHCFAEQMAVLGERPLHYFSGQIESLAFDLSKFPEQINPSVLRTLSQALDFLALILPDAVRLKLRDPSVAQVLIVDDEEGARKIMMAAMRIANLKSVAADTPTAALAALSVQGFDLIFLDVGLPEMTGFDLCTKVRALPLHERTPIVFITGMATFQNRVQSSLSGGNDFVGKPFNISELGLKALIWVFKGNLGMH